MIDACQFFKNKIYNIELGLDIIAKIKKWIGKKYTFQKFEVLEVSLFKKEENFFYYKIKTKTNGSSIEHDLTLILDDENNINSISY